MEKKQLEWTHHTKPPEHGKFIWIYSKKAGTVTMGKHTDYGWFDMKGSGIPCFKWAEILPPALPTSSPE